MRTSLHTAVVLGALVGMANADGGSRWDGAYTQATQGGSELCPDASAPVVVTGGAFSYPWNIKAGDRLYRVGTIAGSVRPSGAAVFKATVTEPLPANVKAKLDEMGDTVEQLQTLANEMSFVFAVNGDRGINLSSGMCYASWNGGEAPTVKPGKGAKAVKPPPPLAAGSPKWDTSYWTTESSGDGWWCPKSDGFGKVVVKKGRFSLPWQVDAIDGNGHEFGVITLGRIDGSIAASGHVKLRAWFAESELPPELAAGRDAKEASLAYVKGFTPTMTFSSAGATRRTHLAFGKACTYDLAASAAPIAKKPRPVDKSTTASTNTASSPSNRSSNSSSNKSASTSKPSPPPPPPPPKGKGNGAECSYYSECASGHCNFGKCASGDSSKQLGNGMACDSSSDCASSYCLFGKCSSKSSSKELASGATCEYGTDCASGQCLFQKCQ